MKNWTFLQFLCLCLYVVSLFSCQDNRPVAWWKFNKIEEKTVHERVGKIDDMLLGHYRKIPGVSDTALELDGYTAHMVRKAQNIPKLAEMFTVQAWIAPQAYPWNEAAILDWEQDQKKGFTFGVNAYGRVYFYVSIEGEWKKLVTGNNIPLWKWTHLAATFDSSHGLNIYINGRNEGSLKSAGKMVTSPEQDLWLGKSHTKKFPWGTERSLSRELSFTEMYWQGLIDEVKLFNRELSSEEIINEYKQYKPAQEQPLEAKLIPRGPEDIKSFGARYYKFQYYWAWDQNWKGEDKPGILVTFDELPIRLTFWRGAAYSPLWISENGIGMSNEFMERGFNGTCELMNDKIAKYSEVEILENTPARAVVYWRNSPARVDYVLPNVRENTGWGDWAEEYHIVYPDGIACRQVKMWTANQEEWYEWSQSLPILSPGQRPEDIFEKEKFVSLATLNCDIQTFSWPKDAGARMEDAVIQLIHFNAEYKPFLIMTDSEPQIWLTFFRPRSGINPGEEGEFPERMSMPTISDYWWWNHWPVAQLQNDGRIVTAADRVGHTWTSTQTAKPYKTTPYSITQVQLTGMNRGLMEDLVFLARSWIKPAQVQNLAQGFKFEGYNQLERAFIFNKLENNPELSFTFKASEASPVLNPGLVIKNWEESTVQLFIDDNLVTEGNNFRYGFRDVAERFILEEKHRRIRAERIGVEFPATFTRQKGKDLIVFIKLKRTNSVKITLKAQ